MQVVLRFNGLPRDVLSLVIFIYSELKKIRFCPKGQSIAGVEGGGLNCCISCHDYLPSEKTKESCRGRLDKGSSRSPLSPFPWADLWVGQRMNRTGEVGSLHSLSMGRALASTRTLAVSNLSLLFLLPMVTSWCFFLFLVYVLVRTIRALGQSPSWTLLSDSFIGFLCRSRYWFCKPPTEFLQE